MGKYSDFPWEEVISTVKALLKENPGLRFYQKFTCSGCGNRLTMSEPNHFYPEGTCDNCSAKTDIKKQGCNYLIIGTPEEIAPGEREFLISGITNEEWEQAKREFKKGK
jgi:hypothetical protein